MLDETEIIHKICNILRSYETSYELEERDDILKVSFYKKDKNIVIVNYKYYRYNDEEYFDNNYDSYIITSKIDLNKNEILDEKCELINNE